ncbi:Hsp70 family protein [Aspergillus stella-maris]|uniref:Hsp70 family protein n=1 Tax=Aspergillus stella-maris TaxID=1810926 RepID=UPI003CCE1E14
MPPSRFLSAGALDALNSVNARNSYNGTDGDITWPLQGLALREEDDQLVIGIDFGTTFSGVAWATPESFEADQINLISAWPGTGREEGKAPSELLYDEGRTMWGYNIPGGADTVRGFKLLLLHDEDLTEDVKSSEFYLRARKMLRDMGKTVVGLIADYLRGLWKHTIETINKSLGDYVVDGLKFHVVITVPAIWKAYARQGMKDAAKSAGILKSRKAGETTLSFVPEPEAAALSTLCERGRRIKKGDVYVICDAGGGTVDLISYEIKDTNPIAMREAVEGRGSLCGGLLIDEAFEAICKRRLGRRWDNLSKKGINDVMRGEWEQYIKPQFTPGSTNGNWIVGIPAEAFDRSSLDDLSKQPYIKQGRIHFRDSDIEQAFKSSFAGINSLVDKQVKKAKQESLQVKGIILVGGLGTSPYLYEHLKTRYSKHKISVLQSSGIKPRTAICRGAIYKGFLHLSESNNANQQGGSDYRSIAVVSTIARISIGTVVWRDFRESKDLEEDRMWDYNKEKWRANNQMLWYIRKGDDVSTKDRVSHQYHQIVDQSFNGKLEVEMYQCEADTPSTRKASNVKPLCTISCQLDVPTSQLESFIRSDGTKMKHLYYDIVMVPSGAAAECTVYIDGRKQGSQNVTIKFQ